MKIKALLFVTTLAGCGPIHMDASISMGDGIVTERRSAIQDQDSESLVDRIATSLLDEEKP